MVSSSFFALFLIYASSAVSFGYFFNPKNIRSIDDNVVEKYLIGLKDSQIITSFPSHNFCVYRIMLCTQHVGLMPLHMTPKERQIFKKNYETRDSIIDLNELVKIAKFTGLSILIIDRKTLKSCGYGSWKPPEEWQEVCLNQNSYKVIVRSV